MLLSDFITYKSFYQGAEIERKENGEPNPKMVCNLITNVP